MYWVYLSPHFDDAVLSCGGLIWEQIQSGDQVEIWTLCAGKPPQNQPLTAFAEEKHRVWNTGPAVIDLRRAEDEAACAVVGAQPRYWTLPDCIYRRLPNGDALVNGNSGLWAPVHPGEIPLVKRLRAWLRRSLPAGCELVCPLTLGNHIDHRLTRAAVEGLRRPVYYYADFPYVAGLLEPVPAGLPPTGLYSEKITPDGLKAWQNGIAAYVSQVDDLFGSQTVMREKIEAFWQTGGGSTLWRV
jgi:LmbE family N-acetylglucosaminyl deacetylase